MIIIVNQLLCFSQDSVEPKMRNVIGKVVVLGHQGEFNILSEIVILNNLFKLCYGMFLMN